MKKIIDDHGRLFGKISILDIAALLIAVVLLIAAYMKFDVVEVIAPTVGTTPVSYTVTAYNIRESNARLIRPGDAVWTETGARIGTVQDVVIRQATHIAQLVDGSYTVGIIEEKVDVDIIIDAQYTESGGRRLIDRVFDLSVNREDSFRTKYQFWYGTITAIDDGNG